MEIAIVLILALVVFGPKKLPELGRSVGKGLKEFRSSVAGMDSDNQDKRDAEDEKPAIPVSSERVS